MKFTIELEIGLFFPLTSALPKLKTDRNAKTHRRGRIFYAAFEALAARSTRSARRCM
jgi:hypothetical protein